MDLLLHPATARQIDAVTTAGRSGLVLHGPAGTGKRTAAMEIARRLNCLGDEVGECVNCRRLRTGAMPDVITLGPEEKASITVAQVRDLAPALAVKPYQAGATRVIIIAPADAMTDSAQNALLKLLEEPPPATLFVLVAGNPLLLLETVRSRLAAIYFAPMSANELAGWLTNTRGVASARAAKIAADAAGRPGVALALLEANAAAAPTSTTATGSPDASPYEVLVSGTQFAALVAAKDLAATADATPAAADFLQSRLLTQVRGGEVSPEAATRPLAALETCRQMLVANVSPRAALERLIVGWR